MRDPSVVPHISIRGRHIYYGWALAYVVGITELVSWGILYYAFGVLLTPMQRELGWSSAQLSGAFSLALLCGGLAALPFGRWLDQRGPRMLMTLGSIIAVVLVVAWATTDNLIAFYLLWGAIGIVTAAVLYEPAFWIVTTWFSGEWASQRGKALTIVTFFGGLASTVFVPLTNALKDVYGWRGALIALAIILALLTILPHALLLRNAPNRATASFNKTRAATQPTAHLKEATRTPAFWILSIAFALSSLIMSVIGVHFISFKISQGVDAATTAYAAGLVGVMQVVGRLTIAPLGDRLPRKYVTSAVYGLIVLGLLSLLVLSPTASLYTYVVLYGIGVGATTPLRPALIASTFGAQGYGTISSSISLLATFARSIAPVLAGLFVASNGYLGVFVALVIAAFATAVLVLFLPDASH
jgi:MFS family permease